MMKRIAIFFSCVLLLCMAVQHVEARENSDSISFGDKVRNEIKKYLGIPYVRGGSSKRGVDCSGFVRLIYRSVCNLDLPCTARVQFSLPVFKKVSESVLQTGDLIFFSPTIKKKKINHVGIYLSGGKFAHAIQKKGVTISSLEDGHWKARIISFKRFENRDITDEREEL